jgi:hypothetical protein
LLRRASWLVLLSLAWMQLALAGHQFEHSPTYTGSCEICVQFDRLDDVIPVDADAEHALGNGSPEPPCEQVAHADNAPASSFDARAPPVT